jgi:hypothetical protein
MRDAIARYDGPATHCPPGAARGHEVKVQCYLPAHEKPCERNGNDSAHD